MAGIRLNTSRLRAARLEMQAERRRLRRLEPSQDLTDAIHRVFAGVGAHHRERSRRVALAVAIDRLTQLRELAGDERLEDRELRGAPGPRRHPERRDLRRHDLEGARIRLEIAIVAGQEIAALTPVSASTSTSRSRLIASTIAASAWRAWSPSPDIR